jgi:hypothetical protein
MATSGNTGTQVRKFMKRGSGGPRNWVKYPDGTIGPNDARAKDRYGTGLPPAFPLTAARKQRASGAAGYNKGKLPG